MERKWLALANDPLPLHPVQTGHPVPVMKSVTLDPQTLHANPVHRALHLIKVLHDEGIPAFGAIALEGVESGTLHITAPDICTGEVTYSWTDE